MTAASRCTKGARSKKKRRHPFGGVAAFFVYGLRVMDYALWVMGYVIRGNHHTTTTTTREEGRRGSAVALLPCSIGFGEVWHCVVVGEIPRIARR
jgi:hypothetical protein